MKIFNWIGTLWGGSHPVHDADATSRVGFIAMFTIGGLSGVMHASPPVDLQQTDTYFVVAHFHYVLFGGSIFGLIAGAYYWWPKMIGRLLDERLGKLHFWLMLIGFNLTFFPMHFLGLHRHAAPDLHLRAASSGWDFWNLVSTIGAFMHRRCRSWCSSSTSSGRCARAPARRPIRGTAHAGVGDPLAAAGYNFDAIPPVLRPRRLLGREARQTRAGRGPSRAAGRRAARASTCRPRRTGRW